MALTPTNVGGSGGFSHAGLMDMNYFTAAVDATTGRHLLSLESINGFIKLYPERDKLLKQLVERLIGQIDIVDGDNFTWYRLFNEATFGRITIGAHGAAGGAGQAITATINSGYIDGKAAWAWPGYNYVVMIGGVRYQCKIKAGGINTSVDGAWVVTIFPKDPTVTLPASAVSEQIIMLDSQVAEGNTVHAAEGRTMPFYSEMYQMVLHETHGFRETDLAAFSARTAFETANIQMADGRMVDIKFWVNTMIALAIAGWEREGYQAKLFGSGDVDSSDPVWQYASVGFDEWVETRSGNNFQLNPGGIGLSDIQSILQSLRSNYESMTSYTIHAGVNVRRLFQDFFKSNHYAGMIRTTEKDNATNVDFEVFTVDNTRIRIPIVNQNEMDNPYGWGGMGYSNIGWIVPDGMVAPAYGDDYRKPISWRTLMSGNPAFGGKQGKYRYTMEVGGSFGPNLSAIAASVGAAPLSDSWVVPTKDNRMEIFSSYIDGQDFVKPYLFGRLYI